MRSRAPWRERAESQEDGGARGLLEVRCVEAEPLEEAVTLERGRLPGAKTQGSGNNRQMGGKLSCGR